MDCVIVLMKYHHHHDNQRFCLIRKQRPAWQKGKLNLPGGKIDPGETPEQAAAREVQEETGFSVYDAPKVLGKIVDGDTTIYCVKASVWYSGGERRASEDEEVLWMDWYQIQDDPNLIPNLRVIIPLMAFGFEGWVITDEDPSFGKATHEFSISVKSDLWDGK